MNFVVRIIVIREGFFTPFFWDRKHFIGTELRIISGIISDILGQLATMLLVLDSGMIL